MPTAPNELAATRVASRIWARDSTVFGSAAAAPAVRDAILNRLGWLTAPSSMAEHLAAVTAVAADVGRDGLTDIYLLGMGGSSLCAEVLRDVLGTTSTLNVLDTTDERAIAGATAALVPSRACFIVASKSGSTVEVTSLERHFRAVMEAAVGGDAGRHFLAITDPGTSLARHAAEHHYRHTFVNPADIGGRYSALSLFGLVPAALGGIDVAALLASGASMADRCRSDAEDNPGLSLGAFMGGCALDGRDKLTLLLPSTLSPLGAWVEQLVAESTGKNGRGVLPVVGEPLGDPSDYGADRAFVAVTGEPAIDRLADRLSKAGHPVFRIDTQPRELGAEFFRWEFATAVAGAVLGLNPFDEPDVRGAKERTQAQLDARNEQGAFRLDPPFEHGHAAPRREIKGATDPATPRSGRYLAILDYLPAEPHRAAAITRLRERLRQRTGMATTHGVGPRYLHSTGQYHKGGPNTGLFLLVTAADQTATAIPGAGYTFSVLKQAQAFGDFDALAAAGRHVIHYHFEDAGADFAAELERVALELV